MIRTVIPIAAVVVACVLVIVSGCSRPTPAAPSADATPPAPNLIRMAALCHEHGGEWLKETGCRMTEKLCTSTYHGTWDGVKCTMAKVELKNCNNVGTEVGADRCSVAFLDLDASQEMK